MPKQVDVLVREIHRDEQGRINTSRVDEPKTISYNAFLKLNSDDQPRFELLGEVESVDKDGNVTLRLGNPNLEAQHRQVLKYNLNGVERAVESGPSQKEKEQQAEIERLKAIINAQQKTPAVSENVDPPPLKERKKPGPKKRELTETEIAQ